VLHETAEAAACRQRSVMITIRYMHSPVELVQLEDVHG
jgi:putative aminopeptidase FrvX